MQKHVFPLFPTPLGYFEVEDDFSKLEEIPSRFKFNSDVEMGPQTHLRSETLTILDHYPDESKLFMKYFNIYKDEFLKFSTTDFQITTSWATRTESLSACRFHSHANCLFSAIFYFEDVKSGDIEFETSHTYQNNLSINDPTEWNNLNSFSFKLTPKKGTLLFFPSTLTHRIGRNYSDKVRHSLAFNLFPVGQFGSFDSTVNVSLNKINI